MKLSEWAYLRASSRSHCIQKLAEEFCKPQAQRVRDLADKADPFTKKRLLDLADKYDVKAGKPSRASKIIERPTPLPTNQARP